MVGVAGRTLHRHQSRPRMPHRPADGAGGLRLDLRLHRACHGTASRHHARQARSQHAFGHPFAPRPQARPDRHGRRPHLHRRGDGPQRQSDGSAGAFGRNDARRSRQSRSAAAHHRRQHRTKARKQPRSSQRTGTAAHGPASRNDLHRQKGRNNRAQANTPE